MHDTMTTADRISAMLGHDGQRWEDARGRHLEDLCKDAGGYCEMADGDIRWAFDDGSAIVPTEGGWDIEGKEPFVEDVTMHDTKTRKTETRISLTDDETGEQIWSGDPWQFCLDNRDGMDEAEIDAICNMRPGDFRMFGGGAAPLFRIDAWVD